MSDANGLLDAIRARSQGRRRVPIGVVWDAFLAAVRGYTGSVEARSCLAGLLHELARERELQLPRGDKLWEQSASPPLPVWVALPPEAVGDTPRIDHRSIPWPPELAFVASMRNPPQLDDLLAIQRFLAAGGRQRRLVPARERSVELFGDEKRIDALVTSAMFRDGKLSLALLRCYDVAPPLVWELCAGARPHSPVLVLENLHSYDSFRRWNRGAGHYAAVAYGHGSEFKGTCRDLPRVCAELGATTVHYFGDLDVEGLAIPVHARRVLRELENAIALDPATRWYERLFEHRHAAAPAKRPATVPPALIGWLPPHLREAAREILDAGRRLPQELVGTDALEHP